MLFPLIKASLLGNIYLLWSTSDSQETNTSSPYPKVDPGAVPCPLILLSIPISQIRNLGSRYRASLLAGIFNFYKRFLKSLTFLAPASHLALKSTEDPPPPNLPSTGKAAHHELTLLHRLMFSVPNFPHLLGEKFFLTFSDWGGGWGVGKKKKC